MWSFEDGLKYAVEAFKVLGGLASIYAVIKLRKIEKKYLFKATIPELIESLGGSLESLNISMLKPSKHRADIARVIGILIVDGRNIRRKTRGDSLKAANELLDALSPMKPGRFFWQAKIQVFPDETALLRVYEKGMGLIRALENDLNDQSWSAK